jgi:hypothetical protein
MSEDLIQLPNIEEIKEMLDLARNDIRTEVEQDPEIEPSSQLLIQVMDVIDSKLAESKDFSQLSQTEKIDIAAHLNFLQALLEDFFMFDGDFEDEDFDLNDEELEDVEDEK